MSHCCGGCGGEDPLMKKENKTNQNTDQLAEVNKELVGSEKLEKPSADKATANVSSTTGTWQPPGQ